MIRGVISSILATAICAFCGWLWLSCFSDAFFSNTAAFVLYGIIVFIAGLVIGCLIGWSAKGWRSSSHIVKKEFDGLSDECKDLLLLAYESEGPSTLQSRGSDRFPNHRECFQDLKSRGLLHEYDRANALSPVKYRVSDKAKSYLDKHEKMVAALRQGADANEEKTIERMDKRLMREWRKASRLHKLVTVLSYNQRDVEEISYFSGDLGSEFYSSPFVDRYVLEDDTVQYHIWPKAEGFIDRNKALLEEEGLWSASDDEIVKEIIDIATAEN